MMKKFYLSALLVGTTAIAIAQASDPAAKAIQDVYNGAGHFYL